MELDGQYPDAIHFILDGLFGLQPNIGKEHIFGVLTPGMIINDAPMLGHDSRCHNVKCLEQATVLTVDCAKVKQLLLDNAWFAHSLTLSLSRKLELCSKLLFARTEYAPHERVTNALAALAYIYPERKVSLNLVQLAALLNLSRHTVANVVKSLKEQQLVTRRGKCFVIDPSRLLTSEALA